MKTCAIVNVIESSIARDSNFVLPIHCGPEIGVASTKAFLGQILVLYILALIEEGMPVVVLAPRDNYYKKTISNMQEVIARGAKVLLITNKSKDEVVSENIWETIEVENTNDDLLPFLLTIPLQKLAYYSALKKGYDIDKPRNLAKSVTVE